MAGRHVAITAAAVLAVPLGLAAADDSFRHARVRLVEPGVSLQSASEPGAEEATTNMPFLPGDRVWTDGRGRVEFHFADGSLLRVDRRTKLDYDGYDGERGGQVVLRLWSGSVFVHQRENGRSPEFVIETPAAATSMRERGVYRVDVAEGETRLSVFEGEAYLEADERVRVGDGQRAFARRGERATGPDRFDPREGDDFARWDAELGDEAYASRSEYLPEEVSPFAEDFERNGSWYFESGVGNVWRPHVSIGWRPYTNGRWAWTAYGWTWVPNEPWGWAPFHYGRWDHSSALGWYWIPGRTWGPAWVSWSVSNDHVGWCPLGYRDRPVVVHDRNRGRAVPRGSAGSSAWTYVRRADLGSRDIARRRVEASAVPIQAMRTVDTGSARVTREGTVAEGHAVPRNIRTKPGPGDTVPELRTDNMTTIPFPVERTRYESERERERERQQDGSNPSFAPRGRRQPADQGIRPDTSASPEVTGWGRGRTRSTSDGAQDGQPAATGTDGARRRPETTRTEDGDREALRQWFGRIPRDDDRSARPRGDDRPVRQREEQAAPRERPRQETESPRTVQPRHVQPREIRSEPKRERVKPPPPPQNDGGRERGAVRRDRSRDRDH